MSTNFILGSQNPVGGHSVHQNRYLVLWSMSHHLVTHLFVLVYFLSVVSFSPCAETHSQFFFVSVVCVWVWESKQKKIAMQLSSYIAVNFAQMSLKTQNWQGRRNIERSLKCSWSISWLTVWKGKALGFAFLELLRLSFCFGLSQELSTRKKQLEANMTSHGEIIKYYKGFSSIFRKYKRICVLTQTHLFSSLFSHLLLSVTA